MPRLLSAALIAATITASPALSGNLSDPVLEQELIIAEAQNDSAKVDMLMVALTLAMVIAWLGN